MKNLVLIFSFLLLSLYSCNKEDDTPVPPITAENTFSCKIDGELFIAKEHGGFIPNTGDPINVTLGNDNSWKIILGDGTTDIYLYLYNLNATGIKAISGTDGDLNFVGDSKSSLEMQQNGLGFIYSSSKRGENVKILTLDLNEKLILEFEEIRLIEPNNPNNYTILKEGKLNINLNTLDQ